MDPFYPGQSSNPEDVNVEGNYIDPLPAHGQHPLPAEGQDPLPAHGQDPLPAHGQDPLPAHGQHPLPAHGQDPLPAHGQDPLPAHGQDPFPAHGQDPLPAHRQDPHKPGQQHMDSPGDSLQGGNYGSTQGQSQNHPGQDYLLQSQLEMQGAGYQHPQMPYKNYSQPLMSEGSFLHHQMPQGPSFPGVIQPNPAFGSNFYLPSSNLFFPNEDYFHPHHGMLPMNPSGFISPTQLPFPPPNPFMRGWMPEYHPSQVKSESCQGPSMMPPSFSSGIACAVPRAYQHEDFSTEMAHSHDPFGGRSQRNDGFNNKKNFGYGVKGQFHEPNNNFGDESEGNINFENRQSKQTSINSSNKIAAKVLKPEHKSPIVEPRNNGSNMIPKENRRLSPKVRNTMEILSRENRLPSPKDKTTINSENKLFHSITNANQAKPIPPKSSNVKLAPKYFKPNCPKPRSTLTIPKRKMSLSDLSTASPFKLTSPTPVTPEQLEATRMQMVFSPKLVADTPCPVCAKHKSHMTVQCVSPPAKEHSDDSTFGDGTPDSVGEANGTLEGLLCEMCGKFLELDPNEIINVSYLTGDNNFQEHIFSDQFFGDGPLGNIECAQTSLAGKVKKVLEEIVIISDDDDIKSPIGKSRRTMQFKGKMKKRSNESSTGTIKKEITRPFACNVCSKTYIREHALKAHVKNHLVYSPVKLPVEPVTNESKKKEVNANLVSQNADIENNSPGPYSPRGFPFDELQSGISGPFIQKSSITDDEINDLLISSDDEAAPPIFMPKLVSTRIDSISWNESTIKKELMENTNTQFEIKADSSEDKEDTSDCRNEGENLFMMKDKTEDSFNMPQDLNEKIIPPICCPQIMKESAKNEKIKAKRVNPRTCWYCLSLVSMGPWQVHKYQPNKYLCSSCFQMHKAKAENKDKHENHLPKKIHCEGFEETLKAEEIEENMVLGSNQNIRQDDNELMQSQLMPEQCLE